MIFYNLFMTLMQNYLIVEFIFYNCI